MSEKTNDIGPQPGPDFVRPDTPAHRWLEEANAAASSDWIDGFNKCAELRIAPSKGGPTPYFNRSMVEVHAYQYHARHPFDCLERAAEIASEADAEIERLRARVAELEPDANAFRAMVNLQMYIGFRQGTVEAFSDGILAASVFNLGHDALSAARNAIADHATALNECSKKADDALAKDAAP